ncbi:MAG: tetratricopeptide repeat protein [Myxococcota bacterium]
MVGFERLGEQRDPWLLRLNYAREGIAADVPAAVVLWMFDEDATALAAVAPDLWAWRSGVFEFPPPHRDPSRTVLAGFVWGDTTHKQRRLATIEEYLATPLAVPSESQALMHAEAAAILLELFRNSDARVHIDKARAMFRDLGREDQVARLRGLEGRALFRLGQMRAAETALCEALKVLESHHDSFGQVVTLGDLANLRAEKGDVDEAIELLNCALEIATDAKDLRSQALVEERLADLYSKRGEVDEAIAGLETRAQLGVDETSGVSASTLRNLGRMEARRGRHPRALQLLGEAARMFKELGDRREHDITQGDIVNVHILRGDYERAMAICQALLALNRVRGDDRSASHNLWLKGRILIHQGQSTQALETLERSYRISLEIDNAEGIAMVGQDYGQQLIDTGDNDQARVVLAEARDAFQRLGQPSQAAAVQELLDTLCAGGELTS